MRACHIAWARRTPVGRIGGALAHARIDDLLAALLRDCADSLPLDPGEVGDVVVGCANQAGEDNRNLARMAWLLAGLPESVPAVTLNRLCGSGLDAVADAAARISAGLADCVLAGGAESMTRAPLVVSKGSRPFGRDSKMHDTTFGWRFPNPAMERRFPLLSMGETAEELARERRVPRERQDAFALASHRKAVAARDAGRFGAEVLPVEAGGRTVSRDEGPRDDTDAGKLAALRPAFREGGTVTAGNSSPMSDGAALLLVASEEFLGARGLPSMGRVLGAAAAGVHPNRMGLGPVPAAGRLLARLGMGIGDFGAVELNEAFAVQALACMDDLGVPEERVNVNGGAIALGHPLGCSGARILVTLAHAMADRGLENGLAAMCVGVGQGVALALGRG